MPARTGHRLKFVRTIKTQRTANGAENSDRHHFWLAGGSIWLAGCDRRSQQVIVSCSRAIDVAAQEHGRLTFQGRARL
jgi:hypothetical protein